MWWEGINLNLQGKDTARSSHHHASEKMYAVKLTSCNFIILWWLPFCCMQLQIRFEIWLPPTQYIGEYPFPTTMIYYVWSHTFIGNCSNPCKIWAFQKDIFKFVTPWFIHWCYLVCISLVDSTICFWSQIFLFGVTTKLQFGIHMQMTINGWA